MDAAIARHGGVGAALEALRASGCCRLRPLKPEPLSPVAAFVSAFHLGDPIGPRDSWRPWKRRRAARLEARQGRLDGGAWAELGRTRPSRRNRR
jgi:hypothetical protein